MAQDSSPTVETAAESLSSPLMPETPEKKESGLSLGFADILTFTLAITCGKRHQSLGIESFVGTTYY